MSARRGEFLRQRGVLGVVEVQHDRRLLRLTPEVVGRDPVPDRRLPGPGVVAARALDLDHVGAEVGQQHRGVRPGQHPGEVGDQQPGQRPGAASASAAAILATPRPSADICPLSVASLARRASSDVSSSLRPLTAGALGRFRVQSAADVTAQTDGRPRISRRTCAPTPGQPGRPWSCADGTVLTMDDAHQVLTGADVLVVDDRIAAVGPDLEVPDGHRRDRRHRRHRDAGHDRHPPAHVADRDARLRRRLDPDPVLRLVLPGARPHVPARGHLRRQPAAAPRGDRRRGHHHRRLVARAADRRPRRGGGRRAAGGPGPVRAGVRQHPGRPVGVDGPAGGPPVPASAARRGRRPARASSWPSTSPATRRSRSGRPSRSPASSGCR